MATKKTSAPTLPLIFLGRVVGWQASMSLVKNSPYAGDASRGGSRYATLEIELLDPIKGRKVAQINVHELGGGKSSPAEQEQAAITSMSKSVVNVSAMVSSEEMSGLMALATSSRLKSCLLACNEPYRGRAPLIALRVGTQEPNELG